MKNSFSIKLFLLSITLPYFFSVNAPAAMRQLVKIHGTVERYTDEYAIIRTKSGPARVPTRSIAQKDRRNLHPGSEVTAELKFDELISLNTEKGVKAKGARK